MQCFKCIWSTQQNNHWFLHTYVQFTKHRNRDVISKLTASFTLVLIFWFTTTKKGMKIYSCIIKYRQNKTDINTTNKNKITRFQTDKSWVSSPLIFLPVYPSDLEQAPWVHYAAWHAWSHAEVVSSCTGTLLVRKHAQHFNPSFHSVEKKKTFF